MTKTLLLGAAAALVLSASAASAATHPTASFKGHIPHHSLFPSKAKTLYDQTGNSDTGVGIVSQNFTDSGFSIYDAQGAGDFKVPKKTTWTVTEVDTIGVYFNGYGPADSENVIFYADSKGKPGKKVAEVDNVTGGDSSGSFTISLGKKGVKLKGGKTYWVSVVANMAFGSGGEWGWELGSKIAGNEDEWQNPGGGLGTSCATWGPNDVCLGYAGDYEFALKGTAKKGK